MSISLFLSIFSIILQNISGNVIQNGDFESGTADPWFCASCKCTVIDGALGKNPYNLDKSWVYFLEVTNRNANWAGARQDLNVGSFSEDNLQLWFNFSIQANEQAIKKYLVHWIEITPIF